MPLSDAVGRRWSGSRLPVYRAKYWIGSWEGFGMAPTPFTCRYGPHPLHLSRERISTLLLSLRVTTCRQGERVIQEGAGRGSMASERGAIRVRSGLRLALLSLYIPTERRSPSEGAPIGGGAQLGIAAVCSTIPQHLGVPVYLAMGA